MNGVRLDVDAVFLAANGDRRTAGGYRAVARSDVPVAAYAPLYGASPSGAAFDLAVAAVSLKESTLYPSPVSDAAFGDVIASGRALASPSRVGCLECGPDGSCNLLVVSRES